MNEKEREKSQKILGLCSRTDKDIYLPSNKGRMRHMVHLPNLSVYISSIYQLSLSLSHVLVFKQNAKKNPLKLCQFLEIPNLRQRLCNTQKELK